MSPASSLKSTVSVVIPHHDGLPRLRECLQALAAQTRAPDEVLVADNGSPQGLDVVARLVTLEFPTARTLHVEPRGAAHARNAGVAASLGDVIAFVDADVTPAMDWLERGLEVLATHPIVGGRVDVALSPARAMSAIEAWDMLFGHNASKSFRRSAHLLTGNLFVRREIFEAVGDFRNGVPEDVEWCHRAIARGHSLHYSEAPVVTHPPLDSLQALKARQIRFAEEAYGWRGRTAAGLCQFWLHSLLTLASIAPHASRIATGRIGGLGFKAAIFGVLVRVRWLRFCEAQRLVFKGPRR